MLKNKLVLDPKRIKIVLKVILIANVNKLFRVAVQMKSMSLFLTVVSTRGQTSIQ